MKNKKMKIIFILVGMSLVLPLRNVSGTIIWEEDFENPPFDDWTITDYITISGVHITNPDPNGLFEGFKILDGVLRAPNDSSFQTFKQAYRSSTTAYGSWSFDWWTPNDVGTDPNRASHDIIGFIFNEPSSNYNASGMAITDYLYDITGYELLLAASNASGSQTFWDAPSIQFSKQRYLGENSILKSYNFADEITGIHHIEITRDLDNEFKVYFDSELIITVIDAAITTSEILMLTSYGGDSGFDNVTVDDDITTTTTTTDDGTTGFPAITILLGSLGILIVLRRRYKR